jgi:AhpD family alkylhydroperoxidase
MQPRIEYDKAASDGVKAVSGLEGYVRSCGLEPVLLALVKLRASQIKDCAYCIDMHTKEVRACGETEQRLYALTAWRETPFFSHRERAALAWAEAVTEASHTHVPDGIHELARRHFGETELVDLTLAVVAVPGAIRCKRSSWGSPATACGPRSAPSGSRSVGLVGRRPGGSLEDQLAPRFHRLARVPSAPGLPPSGRVIRYNFF